MYFRMLHDAASAGVTYLLADLAAGEAALIDPRGSDVPVLLAMLGEHRLTLRWVLRTHEHDGKLPRREREALVALGAPLVEHQPPGETTLVFGDEHLQVLATPGHTAGCLSYRWRDRLFSGDLLAADACPHQPGPALPEALWDSVTNRVFSLPDETLLFAGHARRGRAVSTVLEQRLWHPWLGQASRDEFLARVDALRAPSTFPSDHDHEPEDPLRLHH
jgi:glyoxylase-like metal-dependent hydrolase (beta-lactamase superfamily II)